KPSQQGISVIKKLEDKNLRIILSSAFESPVALKSLFYLSGRLPNEFHGLSARVHEMDFTWS
ncbi:MAG: hypothetical protein NXH75_18125, partial [Halobacteriovoraceae bacterium]|nr:hypothetical protein [Halobacteriovoraceae bacterium]